MDPVANGAVSVTLLAERLKIAPDIASDHLDVAAEPVNGLATDARFDMVGFRSELELRAELQGAWAVRRPRGKNVDLSHYQQALITIGR